MSRIFKALSRIEMKAIDRPRAGPISAEELEVFGLRRPSRPNEAGRASAEPIAVEYHPPTGPSIDEIVEPRNTESVNGPTTGCEQDAIEAVRSESGAATIEAEVESPVQLHPPAEATTEQLAQTPLDLLAEAGAERLAEMTLESSLESLAELVQDESHAEQDGTRFDEAGVGDDQCDDEEEEEEEEDEEDEEDDEEDEEEDVGSRPDNVHSLLGQIDAMQESVVVEWITAIGSTEVEAVYTTETFDNVLVVERFRLADAAEADIRRDARLDSNPPEASTPAQPTIECAAEGRPINNRRMLTVGHVSNVPGTMESCPTYFRADPEEDASTRADVELLEPSAATIDSPVESSIESATHGRLNSTIEPSPPEPQKEDACSENSQALAPTPVERPEAPEGERPESLEGATVETKPRESEPEALGEESKARQSAKRRPAKHTTFDSSLPSVGPLLSVRETRVDETDPHLKSLAENILYQMPARSAVVMFTSSADGEGTSDTLGQVATALAARLDGEILIVDCNFHNPRAAKFFDLQPRRDLVHVLAGETGWAQAVSKTRVEHLSVLAGGKFPTPDGLPPHQSDLAMLLTELRHHYRLVLLDTASLSHGEVVALSRLCDATYLVIRLGETSRRTAQQAARLLQNAGGKLRGCVLSNLPVE